MTVRVHNSATDLAIRLYELTGWAEHRVEQDFHPRRVLEDLLDRLEELADQLHPDGGVR
ncbi:MAG TPA: hypothetical protein VFC19_45510 [Candidatus Limnocylindrales bacterium]|nr:hypothetical protein [Candidatus Limnocylindrales bacterium]